MRPGNDEIVPAVEVRELDQEAEAGDDATETLDQTG
jgi:hypothetical protein